MLFDLETLEPRILLAAGIKADFRDDFQSTAPATGWSYLWNAPDDWNGTSSTDAGTGPIGDPDSYQPMSSAGSYYTIDGNLNPTVAPGTWMSIKSTSVHPGSGFNQASGIGNAHDRHAILAWTVDEGGNYGIRNSFVQTNAQVSGGVIFVHVNGDPAIHQQSFGADANDVFDADIGVLLPGDTIYVGFGAGSSDSFDTFSIDYSIELLDTNPAAVEDTTGVLQDQTAATINVLANDFDPNGLGLSITAVTQGAQGSVSHNGAQLSYTPNPGFSGDDTVTYTIDNGAGGSAIGTVNITVVPDGQQTLSFVSNDDEFLNPERGFTQLRTIDNPGIFSTIRDAGQTIVWTIARGDAFRNAPLDQPFLDELQAGFDAARNEGLKVNFRFAYNYEAGGQDAPKSIILGHINQLSPVWHANKDVILRVDAGFIGAWGEWHSSTNGLDNNSDRSDILNAVLAAVPSDRSVGVRYPRFKREIFTGSQESDAQKITAANAFDESNLTRTGHLNDCFLSSGTDVGTYTNPGGTWPLSRELEYVGDESVYSLHGGETCALHARNDSLAAIAEMEQLHTDYLNIFYHPDVIQKWKDEGAFDEIQRRLGYRYELDSAALPLQVRPSGLLPLEFTIDNVGFGELYNQRNVEVVLKNNGTGGLVTTALSVDPRFWSGGTTQTVQTNLAIPGSLNEGTYSVGLRMPDLDPGLRNDPRYSIRFANDNLWDAETGTNFLTETLVVADEASGDVYRDMDAFQEVANPTSLTLLVPGVVIDAGAGITVREGEPLDPIAQSTQQDWGVNLNGVVDWASHSVWVDLTKKWRRWGQVDAPWAAQTFTQPFTDQGLPVEDFGSVWVHAGDPLGTYTFRYEGTATVTFHGNASKVAGSESTVNGVTTMQVNLTGYGNTWVKFRNVDANDPVRNLKMVASDYDINTSQVFRDEYKRRLAPFSNLRFMDWNRTNNSPVTSWSERRLPGETLQTPAGNGEDGMGGVAWEHMIDLANELQKDPWINVPHLADDNYVRELARLWRDNLDPNLTLYVEWSNESWNGIFTQSAGNGYNYYLPGNAGPETVRVSQIFHDEFLGQPEDRLHVTLAGQSVNPWVAQQGILYMTDNGLVPSDIIDSISIAPYFSPPSANSYTNLDDLFADIQIDASGIQGHATVATGLGLELIAYEAGQHLAAGFSNLSEPIAEAAQSDPRMGDKYREFAVVWAAAGGGLVDHFAYIQHGGNSGHWNLLENPGDPGAVKWDAVLGIIQTPGDATIDNVVDYSDFLIVQANYGQSGMWWEQGDFDGDRDVDGDDLRAFYAHAKLSAPESDLVHAFASTNGVTLQEHYTIALTSVPSEVVTVTLAPDGQSQAAPVMLTFQPDESALIPQIVTVAATDDADPEGNHSGLIVHSISSSDPDYAAILVPNIDLEIIDDEPAAVQLRGVAYGNTSAQYGDEAMTAHTALLPGQTAARENYTNYTSGLNRVILEVAGLRTTALMQDDFELRVGNTDDPDEWLVLDAESSIPLPSIDVDGTPSPFVSRVILTWPDNSIRNAWLQVTLKANANTGLESNDVFYFGNQVGDAFGTTATGNKVQVNSFDTGQIRLNQSVFENSAGIENIFDINRDGRVNSFDTGLVRLNQAVIGGLLMFTAPSDQPPSEPLTVQEPPEVNRGTVISPATIRQSQRDYLNRLITRWNANFREHLSVERRRQLVIGRLQRIAVRWADSANALADRGEMRRSIRRTEISLIVHDIAGQIESEPAVSVDMILDRWISG